jgi:hypothetical protein
MIHVKQNSISHERLYDYMNRFSFREPAILKRLMMEAV